MSAAMHRTITALAAAAFVGSHADGLYSQQAGTPPLSQTQAQPVPPAVHPGMQPREPVPVPNVQPHNLAPPLNMPPQSPAPLRNVQPNNPAPPPNMQAYRQIPAIPAQGPRWHGDIEQFREHDMRLWQGGHWRHGIHDDRLGWWWIVGSLWYLYPSPVYPYPDPFAPPLVTPPPPGVPYRYYCPYYEQYYPYVPTCPGGWRGVPAPP